jgi:hypothetical protein
MIQTIWQTCIAHYDDLRGRMSYWVCKTMYDRAYLGVNSLFVSGPFVRVHAWILSHLGTVSEACTDAARASGNRKERQDMVNGREQFYAPNISTAATYIPTCTSTANSDFHADPRYLTPRLRRYLHGRDLVLHEDGGTAKWHKWKNACPCIFER